MRFISLLDADCRFVYVSSTIGALGASEHIGLTPWETVVPYQRRRIEKHVRRVYGESSQASHLFEVDWIDPCGDLSKSCAYFINHIIRVDCGNVVAVIKTESLPPAFGMLTPRQREILIAVGNGNGVKGAAASLGLSVHTVHSHLRAVREIMGMDDINEAVSLADTYCAARKFIVE